mmetsp:Transcript_32759/g.91751  ORF Transcript_32759/g.91751 Transcript_32759/m.91751 type:complete len:303 (-) Transcript_32759:548-1456(-)
MGGVGDGVLLDAGLLLLLPVKLHEVPQGKRRQAQNVADREESDGRRNSDGEGNETGDDFVAGEEDRGSPGQRHGAPAGPQHGHVHVCGNVLLASGLLLLLLQGLLGWTYENLAHPLEPRLGPARGLFCLVQPLPHGRHRDRPARRGGREHLRARRGEGAQRPEGDVGHGADNPRELEAKEPDGEQVAQQVGEPHVRKGTRKHSPPSPLSAPHEDYLLPHNRALRVCGHAEQKRGRRSPAGSGGLPPARRGVSSIPLSVGRAGRVGGGRGEPNLMFLRLHKWFRSRYSYSLIPSSRTAFASSN